MYRMLFASLLTIVASALPNTLEIRAPGADNVVYITNTSKFCMIIPRDPHTNIGDSQYPGGMKTYCSPAGHYDSSQGTLSGSFWRNVAFKTGRGPKGSRYTQLTGCIDASTLDRLNPRDSGGQYDSSGGDGGSPKGSQCLGYKHYVELIEPSESRACIKCCDDYNDCPLTLDKAGCPTVIPGNYFNCN